ncbi:unnamed protein product [Nippostrongylus brasiliensis]|uniref:ANAPC4_WD40 domain-containing protein n=1 Tax=Nippostrongylus brasiliensis TaxID=27835 RepID=A0A0N4Y0Q8_NIPBR|nr:unnamed protein product [Nippostrongylus brasiliensis]
MAWEPFDQRVLAVASNSKILIWRLSVKATNIKKSDLDNNPIVDISTGEVDCFGAWTGGNITRVVPTADGRRLAVLYTGSVISGLAGRAVSAVWSPTGDSLLFASEDSYKLYTVSFVPKNELNGDGITEMVWTGDSRAVPIFDVSPVEFDASELEVEGAVEREIVTIGGKVHALTLSPDGQRVAVSFKENPGVVALFIVDWVPVVRLTPCGFIEAPLYGHPSIQFFLPKFRDGSMFGIVWSSGSIQYLPLLYGHSSSSHFHSKTILDEISRQSSPGRHLPSESLRSSELPSGIVDRSNNEEVVLFTERFRSDGGVE